MKRVRWITFDAGGTLLYPFPSVGHVYAEVMARHGLHLDSGDLDQGFRRAWKQAHATPRVGVSEESEKQWWRKMVIETLRGLEEPKDFDRLFEDLWGAFACPTRWKMFPGTEETLDALQKQGYRLALLSNWDRRLRLLIEGMKIGSFFEEVFISSEVGFEKPDPRMFHHVQMRLNSTPDEFLHVGDSVYHDIEGAKGVGWKSVLITHQSGERKDGEIGALKDLLTMVQGC
jgi:putative hydrolase of the HAD superfamily